MVVDYSNGKIYKICSSQTEEIYVGSTTQKLYDRMSSHKRSYKCFINGKAPYSTALEILKYDDCFVVLIENCDVKDKENLHKRECYYITTLENTVNKYHPGKRSKEHLLEMGRYYRSQNLEKARESDRKKYERDREKILLQRKEFWEKNRERIMETKREKIHCECGSSVNRSAFARHRRSEKHQKYII